MTRSDASTLDVADVFARIAARVGRDLAPDALDRAVTPPTGDHALNDWAVSTDFLATARPAAVLVGLVVRGATITVLLTERTATLRDHAGQIAFPGGKMDPDEISPATTAIREAREEIGLAPAAVTILGYLDPYLSRTGFRIIPVVARIDPPFDLRLNPAEVVDAFEVPLAHLMDPANQRLKQREWSGKMRSFYAIDFEGRTIWGITAGILRLLSEKLYASC